MLERFQVCASLSVPIALPEGGWGLLVAQQCQSPRNWEESEINLLYQVATELALLVQQEEYKFQLRHLRPKSYAEFRVEKERKKTFGNVAIAPLQHLLVLHFWEDYSVNCLEQLLVQF